MKDFKQPNFYKELVEYYKKTPKEKINEDWQKTAEFDKIGPTMQEFLESMEDKKKENYENNKH